MEEWLTPFPPSLVCKLHMHALDIDIAQDETLASCEKQSFFQDVVKGLHRCMFSFTGIHYARHFTSLDRNVMLCCDCYILINLKSD